MKKIIGLCLVLLLSSVSLFAQDGERRNQRGGDPKERIEKMIKDLKLDEDQAEKFRTIETDYNDKMRAEFEKIREASGADRDKIREEMANKREEMDKARDEKNEKIKEFLTEKQYKKYLELQPRSPRGDGPRDRR